MEMAEEDVFSRFLPRFLEPNQKFADTLSKRSLSTSTPCVQRSTSTLNHKIKDDSGYAESLVDSLCSSEIGTSADNVSDFFVPVPGSGSQASNSFCLMEYRNDNETALKPLPKLNLNLLTKSLKRQADSDWDYEGVTDHPSLNKPAQLHTPQLHYPVLPFVDHDFTPDDTETDLTDNSILGGLAVRFTDVLRNFSPKEQDRVIGRKMLLEHVDIIQELDSRNMNICCTSQILKYLDPEDLDRVCHVSHVWRNVCQNDPVANSRRMKFLKYQRKHKLNKEKENPFWCKSPKKSRGLTAPHSTPLHHMQLLGSSIFNSSHSESADTCTHKLVRPKETDKWDLYAKAAQSLINDESLKSCRKCNHPSKVNPSQERAKCQNPRCNFDFCIKCLMDFHGASPCTPVASKRSKADVIGSKKIRKNLRRL